MSQLLSNSQSLSRGSDSKSRSKSESRFTAASQARFGYLGHLSIRDAQHQPDALRTVTALDGASFLPNVMTLQRASTPWQYNTPARNLEEPVHTEGRGDPDSPGAGAGDKKANSSKSMKELSKVQPMPANYVRRIRRRAQEQRPGASDYKTQISDLKLLADSASRSGNVYQALQAYHKMGVVYDNQEMYAEAIQKYKQFLSLCITSKNTQGEALAYNCLGIDSFKLSQFDEAIQYHNKHLELADSTGRLIAHTNLGIVFQAMGLSEHAAIHHQHAIEYANRMGAKDAQCFTVGNLGIASAAQGDLQTSRICLQYHLSAAQRQLKPDNKFATHTLKAVSNNVYSRLGEVNTTDGRLDEAASHFAKAMEVAKSKGDQQSEEKSGAMLGIARGLSNFDKHVESLLKANNDQPAIEELGDM